MPFEDLLKKQISNLGKELNQMLERVLPLFDPNLVSAFVEDANKTLEPEIHAKLGELVVMPPDEIRKILTGRDSEQMENLELLADLLGALAAKKDWPPADSYRQQALALYQYVTTETGTFSFGRNAKIMALSH